MDVLRPPITTINGICYRKNLRSLISFKTDEDDENAITAEEFSCQGDYEEVCDAGLDIRQTEKGFTVSVSVPAPCFKFIIGQRGNTKKRLEMETKTQIQIPRQGVEGAIVITGAERRGVVSARNRILLHVDGAKRKMPFTHFVSFPLNARSIQDAFAEFKDDVLRECDDDRGISFSLFQNPGKLHVTIGTLVLLDDNEIENAREALEWCKQEIIEPLLKKEGMRISIKGLEYMNDDPSEVDVLYAQLYMADESDSLQVIADRIVDHFCSKNLMIQQYDRVKIHATVMNTLFRRDKNWTDAPILQSTEKNRVRTDRESFDAQRILAMFGNHNFGTHLVSDIHISTRHSVGSDGYYLPAAKISLL